MGSLCDIAVCPAKLIITLSQLIKKAVGGFFYRNVYVWKKYGGQQFVLYLEKLVLTEKNAISFFFNEESLRGQTFRDSMGSFKKTF